MRASFVLFVKDEAAADAVAATLRSKLVRARLRLRLRLRLRFTGRVRFTVRVRVRVIS